MSVFGKAMLLVSGAALTGCVTEPFACTDEMRPGILVDIRDSVTSEFLASGARSIARDGEFADTVPAQITGFPHSLAHERPGTYTLTVERANYATWTRTGVVVTDGRCHVNTVSIIARLQR